MDEAPQETKMPRGVLVVVAIGLLACIAAAVLSTDEASGEAANLEWVQTGPVPDSKPVSVPGGEQSMQLLDGKIRATGTNDSGYSLFQIATVLKIDKGAPIGGGRILCSVKAANNQTEIARSSGGLRTTYPRSNEDGIYGQPAPETLLVDFSSHGVELAVLEVSDLPTKFTTEMGVKLEWLEYKIGHERFKYFLPDGKPKVDLELPFDTVWKTTVVPAAKIACTLTTSAGEVTSETTGALKHVSPPINEELEELKEEERDEAEEKEEG
jgi:hypothetical protein